MMVDMNPPAGSVFAALSGREGPPLMRMMFIQGAFEMAQKTGKLRMKGKMIIVLGISLIFIIGDLVKFGRERGENIYS